LMLISGPTGFSCLDTLKEKKYNAAAC